MKYLIFSDESGTWNEGTHYVRSWIRISPSDYDLLRKEVIFSKYETKTNELKWDNFRRNKENFKNIFSVKFDVFITISKPSHFSARSYNVIDIIKNIPISTGGKYLTEKIKSKIINSVRNELFFNYFEKIHIENSIKSLLNNENNEDYKYFVDAPQYLKKGWVNLAKECNIKNISIVEKSENVPGIEVADIISGCISDLLENDDVAKSIYKQFIKEKMIDMNSKKCPNPNLIFISDFSKQEIREMNLFR